MAHIWFPSLTCTHLPLPSVIHVRAFRSPTSFVPISLSTLPFLVLLFLPKHDTAHGLDQLLLTASQQARWVTMVPLRQMRKLRSTAQGHSTG